ncbi:MAG: nitroreductase family deazaflavin-dependent oxidoreductase [Anaerolineae bacterium]
MHFAQVPYARNPNAPIGQLVLLLTTTGRKSGQARVTPLQYEEVDGVAYVASARGTEADWYRNLVACPQVQVQIGSRRFSALAELIADPQRIADFLELRLKRHPRMIGMMMLLEGLPPHPRREQLEHAAVRLALVALHPRSPA